MLRLVTGVGVAVGATVGACVVPGTGVGGIRPVGGGVTTDDGGTTVSDGSSVTSDVGVLTVIVHVSFFVLVFFPTR